MTQPGEVDLSQISPSTTVNKTPREKPSIRRLTSRQVGVIGVTIVDLILAQVAIALGGISVLGVSPFGFLTKWGQALQVKAADAYSKAIASEAVANSSDANTAIALGQVAVTKESVLQNEIGLQTTWNGLWEASYNTTLSSGVNKTATDVKGAQVEVRSIAYTGASGAAVNSGNIQGTWDNIYGAAYDVNAANTTLNQVRSATEAIVFTGNTALEGSDTANGNIQNTWNTIYVASGGTGPATNKSLQDARDAMNGVTTTAVWSEYNVYDTWERFIFGTYGFVPNYPDSPTPDSSGAPVTDHDPIDDFGQGVTDTNTTIDDHEARIDEIETTDTGSTSGSGIAVNFSTYADGALPNPPWTVTTVSGSNGLTVVGGNVSWSGSAGHVRVIYNQLQLTTDYQRIGVTVTNRAISSPFYVYGRSDSTGANAVYAKIYQKVFTTKPFVGWYAELWNIATVGSTVTLTKLKEGRLSGVTGAALSVSLRCGVQINGVDYPRKFRIIANGVTGLEHDDSANVTAIGGKYGGFGLQKIGLDRPPDISAWSLYDSKPATYLGAGIRVIRNTATAYDLSGSSNSPAVLSNQVFNAEQIPGNPDLFTWDATIPGVTVKVTGWYSVNYGVKLDGALVAVKFKLCVFHSYIDSSDQVINEAHTIGPSAVDPDYTSMSALVYCNAGDVIKPGYISSGGTPGIVGSANGNTCYFSVAFLNNTKPANPKITTS